MQKEDPLIYFPDEGVSEEIVVFWDDFVLKNIPRGSKVLDIGCGTGRFDQKLAARAASVVGIDLSESDIERARKKNTNKKIAFEVMNGEDLKFEPETFDVVTARAVFHHLDEEIARKQISRVLKKGGKLIVVDVISDFFHPHGKAVLFLTALRERGIFEMIKILPRLKYLLKRERHAHIVEDLKKIRRLHKATVKDFTETYRKYYPGARTGRILCAAYLIWTKPQ